MRQRRVVDRGSLWQRLCGIRLSCRPCYCIAPIASLAPWTRFIAQRLLTSLPSRFILFALALYLLRRRDLAEDVLQDCYISIWHHAADYDPALSQPMTWMLRIVRNRCLDILRRPDIEIPDPDGNLSASWEDESTSPQLRLQHLQTANRLSYCIGQLIPAQRMAIVLGFFDGMSHREIAGRLDAPLGTIKTWTRRGLMQLRRCLR